MLTKVKVQGKTVSEAITKGLRELRMRRDQVEVTVLEHPKKGFLGFGSKPAVVEVRQKRWANEDWDENIYMDVPKRRPHGRNRRGGKSAGRGRGYASARREKTTHTQEPRVRTPKANEPQLLPSESIQNAVIPENLKAPLQEAKEYITNVLTHMGVGPSNVNSWWDEKQQRILVTFNCDKPAIVIGKEGKTLEAIQYLCTLAVTRHFDTPISVVADTQNYWRKAEDKINADIEHGIDMIKRGTPVFRFRPMSAQLRRYIHRAVEGNGYVQTASEGEGRWRKVTFRPTQKALDEAKEGIAPADFVPGVIGEDISEPADTAAQTAPLDTATAAVNTAEGAPETTQAATYPAGDFAAQEGEVSVENDTPAARPLPEETAQAADSLESPTQRMATQTLARTVAQSLVETDTHEVEEHSVLMDVNTPLTQTAATADTQTENTQDNQ